MKNEKKNIGNKRMIKINNLIHYILSLKRKKIKENKNESSEVKLARRLEERSNIILSEEIALNLIIKYEIDNNNKLPSKDELIQLMIYFLGNIQKSPIKYKLNDNKNEIFLKVCELIGSGSQGEIYSYNLKKIKQTKKSNKKLAVKLKKIGDSFTVDIHITSAILLALYDFQPKYYNSNFMEIGYYINKSMYREFHSPNGIYFNENNIRNNIKWFILYNFTNIADQTYNYMKKQNGELIKIDIKHLNSETREKNINNNLLYFNKYEEIFKENKDIILKELDKILILKEKFLIDLIKFRTERGCFNISDKILIRELKCFSSCHKVKKIIGESFLYILNRSKERFNVYHLSYNPAFTWMLYLLFMKNILNDKQYNEYINKFNEKAERYENICKSIEEGVLNKKLEYYENNPIDLFNNVRKKTKEKKDKSLNKKSQTNNIRIENESDKLSHFDKNNHEYNNNLVRVEFEEKFNKVINKEKLIKDYENTDFCSDNNIKNKKKNNSLFSFCYGEKAVDVIE